MAKIGLEIRVHPLGAGRPTYGSPPEREPVPTPVPTTKADVTMEVMSEQLDKEEAGLTTDRGLEGCTPGMQAFELFITSTFRKKYDKVCPPRVRPEPTKCVQSIPVTCVVFQPTPKHASHADKVYTLWQLLEPASSICWCTWDSSSAGSPI